MKLNFAKSLVIGWILVILILSLGLYAFNYPFPVSADNEVRKFLVSEIRANPKYANDSIRIAFLKHEVINLVNKDGTESEEDFQMFEYVVENDSSISTHKGWAKLKKKVIGYEIVGVKLQ